jgi:hypothetical protein
VDDSLTPDTPVTYAMGVEPELTLTLTPPPDAPGQVEALCVEAQAALTATAPTLLLLPADIAVGVLWGALADLLGSSAEKMDVSRAAYARSRFDQFIQLAAELPNVFAAKSLAQTVPVDSAAGLDSYDYQWRGQLGGDAAMVALAGGNLAAIPAALAQPVSLLVAVNAPLPTAPGDPVQLDAAAVDAIVGYAYHIAQFKCGSAELTATADGLADIVKLAATRNRQVRALSTFRDVLYAKALRDVDLAPVERVPGEGDVAVTNAANAINAIIQGGQ